VLQRPFDELLPNGMTVAEQLWLRNCPAYNGESPAVWEAKVVAHMDSGGFTEESRFNRNHLWWIWRNRNQMLQSHGHSRLAADRFGGHMKNNTDEIE